MKENKNNISGSYFLIGFIQGLFSGLANGIPFFQIKNLKETFGRNDDNSLVDENYSTLLKNKLLLPCTYLIGFFLAFILFFYIPVKKLISDYPLAFYGGGLALCVPFFIYEIYKFFTCKNKNYILSIVLFISVLSACFGFYFLGTKFPVDNWTHISGYILLLILSLLGGFLVSYTGISTATLLSLFCLFPSFSSTMNALLYEHSFDTFLFIVIIGSGLLIGYCASINLNYYTQNRNREKYAINSAIYCGSILLFLSRIVFMHHSGISFFGIAEETTPMTAQIITAIATILACAMISIGLTIHGYKFANKKEFSEIENSEDKK